MESHGPLGIIWVGLGLGAFYIALIWLNSLLGLFLTPLFTLLATTIFGARRKKPAEAAPPAAHAPRRGASQ